METRYFEVYNRDNVRLVDINDTPIERITEKGIKTTEREFEFVQVGPDQPSLGSDVSPDDDVPAQAGLQHVLNLRQSGP